MNDRDAPIGASRYFYGAGIGFRSIGTGEIGIGGVGLQQSLQLKQRVAVYLQQLLIGGLAGGHNPRSGLCERSECIVARTLLARGMGSGARSSSNRSPAKRVRFE